MPITSKVGGHKAWVQSCACPNPKCNRLCWSRPVTWEYIYTVGIAQYECPNCHTKFQQPYVEFDYD